MIILGIDPGTRAAGYGFVRYNKAKRTITFECWPRNVDITKPDSKQYPGWPVTISQMNNFEIRDGFQLPQLEMLVQKNHLKL